MSISCWLSLDAILPDRGDVGLQLLLQFGGLALLLARGLEFLLALLDDVRGGGGRLLRRRGLLCGRRRKRESHEACGKQHPKQHPWNRDGRDQAHTAGSGVGVRVNVLR